VTYSGYNSHMEKASISALKNSLSAYLRKVRSGHTVIIYDHNVPIARLVRIEDSDGKSDRLAKIRSEGVTRPALRKLSTKRRRALLTPISAEAGISSALRENRDNDR
jgi:prevent-host-death family protein